MGATHPDRAIAKRLLAGDERAFRELFDDFFPKLYRFALSRLDGDRDAATEVVQQTFCKAFERVGSYRGEASLFGWMCRICRNVITDEWRKGAREARATPLVEDDTVQSILDAIAAPSATQPEQIAARCELVRTIQATLDSLPGHYGDVLEWKYIDGLPVKTIASRLGVGAKAAESLLTRARAAFREALDAIVGSTELIASADDGSSRG